MLDNIAPSSLPESVRQGAGNITVDDREEAIIDYKDIKDSVITEQSSSDNISSAQSDEYSFTFAKFEEDGAVKLDFGKAKEAFEKEFIIQALKLNSGKINQTALKANIPKKTLLRKIEKYEINPKSYY